MLKVTSRNSIFKDLVTTLRSGPSFLPSLGLALIFLTKAIFRGSLKRIFYAFLLALFRARFLKILDFPL